MESARSAASFNYAYASFRTPATAHDALTFGFANTATKIYTALAPCHQVEPPTKMAHGKGRGGGKGGLSAATTNTKNRSVSTREAKARLPFGPRNLT